MADLLANKLSRRERQIMDFLFERGTATAAEVLESLPEPPSYSAVRAMLRTLEEKGFVAHHEDGPRYVYEPTVPAETARRSALQHLVKTFFDGSIEQTLAALIDLPGRKLSRTEVDRLVERIQAAKREGR